MKLARLMLDWATPTLGWATPTLGWFELKTQSQSELDIGGRETC